MFDAATRKIFIFKVDDEERGVDPIEVDWAMELALEGEDRDALRAQAEGEDGPAAVRASAKMLAAIRSAFGVTPYDHAARAGLTAEQSFDLFVAYRDWCDDLKADGGTAPSSSPSPDTRPASPSPTSASSGSGGTDAASRPSRASM